MISSLGIFTGRINPRAGNILWKAGEDSLIDDVKVQGGGGTQLYDGKGLDSQGRPGGDPVMQMHYDETRPSILVTDGGGGTFSTIWSPNTFASAGFYVSDTKTPGHVYQLSNEHHIRNEIVLDHVANWEFLSPQTEQEVGEQGDAISLEIRNSSNLLFANYHGYRVTRNFKPNVSAVKLYNSGDIRFRNVAVNAESGYAYCDDEGCGTYLRVSKFPFENAITDMTHGIEVREREFAVLDVPANLGPAKAMKKPAFAPPPGVFPDKAKLRKVADGFWSISARRPTRPASSISSSTASTASTATPPRRDSTSCRMRRSTRSMSRSTSRAICWCSRCSGPRRASIALRPRPTANRSAC